MSNHLTGSISGESRAKMEAKARELGAKYYGEEAACIKPILEDPVVETVTVQTVDPRFSLSSSTFSADFIAAVLHRSNNPSYGFPKCMQCGKQLNR